MGMKTIAEGIENRETYDFLENIGCDIAQGFMISRPLPAEEYTKWHTQNNGCFRQKAMAINVDTGLVDMFPRTAYFESITHLSL